ncbi:MAG: hypothetical protein ACYDDS_10090 [Candidatus Sulfotelmatobacter sp.]|jgi:hypothetical protein
MNYRLQLSPISGTHKSQLDLLSTQRSDNPVNNWQDAAFFRSWLVYDSDVESGRTERRGKWSKVLGLALAVVVSAAFWLGVGLTIARAWK